MKNIKKLFMALFIICILIGIYAMSINAYIKNETKNNILTYENAGKGYDCILVLGCKVNGDYPSHMLRERLITAIELYKNGVSDKIIMSGDHGREGYDEVNAMKQYAIDNGVPSEDIFMDHAGFSTYESMYRAKAIFGVERIIISTQDYHLYRAIYDAQKLGIEAYGVAAEEIIYSGQTYAQLREILARNKDFIYCIFKPKPTYLGEAIPIQGNGNITNDK